LLSNIERNTANNVTRRGQRRLGIEMHGNILARS
jgi:hypothetical protein